MWDQARIDCKAFATHEAGRNARLDDTFEHATEGIRQRRGKRVTAFAVEGDLDVDAMKSNTFEMEWPPKGGKLQSFPEIDRAAWFDLSAAHVKMLESRRPLVDRLVELVDRGEIPAP
jgi:predicted NUDIX family NTP pyrophosphohydrolase